MTSDGDWPLVGRDVELSAAHAILERLRIGRGGALVALGPAGIGKTRFIEEVLELAASLEIVNVRDQYSATAQELEADVAFGPLARALDLRPDVADPGASELGVMLRFDQARVTGSLDDRSYRVGEEIVELLERRCLERSALLVVDDAQWADRATVQVLDRLVRRSAHLPLMVLVAARTYPDRDGLSMLRRTVARAGGEVLTLGPLPSADLVSLAEVVFGRSVGPRLCASLEGTGGNPFLTATVISAVQDQVEVVDGRVDLVDGASMSSARSSIVHDLGLLDNPDAELLRTAAVLGTTFEPGLLAVAVDSDVETVTSKLHPALAAGVIIPVDNRLAFSHDLVRESIRDDEPEALRSVRHRIVAERFAAARQTPELVAQHLVRASVSGVPDAAGWLFAVGRAMVPRSHGLAVRLLERALDAASDTSQVARIRLELGTALAASRPREALAILDRVDVNHLDERDAVAVLRLRAELLVGARSTGRARDELVLLGAASTTLADKAHVLVLEARCDDLDGLPEQARARLDEAASLVPEDDHELRHLVLSISAHLDERYDRFEGAATQAYEAVVHAKRLRDPRRFVESVRFLAGLVDLEWDPVLEELLAEVGPLVDRLGDPLLQAEHEWAVASLYNGQGRWAETSVRYEAALSAWAELERLDDPSALCLRARLARLDLLTGARARGAASVAELRAVLDTAPQVLDAVDRGKLLRASALLRRQDGDFDGSWSELSELCGVEQSDSVPSFYFVAMASLDLLETAELDDDGHRLRAVVEWAQRMPVAAGEHHAERLQRYHRLLLDGPPEDLVAVCDEIERATLTFELTTAARHTAGWALRRRDAFDTAADCYRRALTAWSSVRADWHVERARSALEHLGIAVAQPPAHTERPTIGWDSLTDAETRVVLLAAEGLTYRSVAERLFISRRTVETHMAHVFDKLGCSSRRELAALLLEDEGRRWLARTRS